MTRIHDSLHPTPSPGRRPDRPHANWWAAPRPKTSSSRGLIPPGHKVATRDIAQGEPVRRYNQIIGFASKPIAAGEHVHTHNLDDGRASSATTPSAPTSSREPPRREATFMGIKRADGRVATRNYIGILSSVNCSATAARAIADHFSRQNHPEALADYPNVDGVVALTHGTGCGMDTEGMGMQILERTLAGYATHANFCGVLVVGLGCEANQINAWLAHSSLREGDTLQGLQHPGHRRHPQDRGKGHRADQGDAAAGQRREARALQRGAHHHRPAMRRLGRLLGHQRQPGAGRGGGPAGGARRHGHPFRDARDLRRRAPADAPRREARSRREADRAHQVVGALHRRSTRAR